MHLRDHAPVKKQTSRRKQMPFYVPMCPIWFKMY